MAYYRSKTTGRTQFHPRSGLGDTFNSIEIGEDGRPVKPYTSLAPTPDELKKANDLLKDHTASPLTPFQAATERAARLARPQKTTGKPAVDKKKKQEGAD